MSDNPVVTVVVPTHNRCHLLKETVASVYAQTFEDWELIIVDDGSEDDTWTWLQGHNDERVRKIRLEKNPGVCVARNTGLQAAKGKYIQYLDDDDLLIESALQTHVEALEKHPTAIGSVGGYTMFDGNAKKTVRIIQHRTVRYIWHDFLFGWVATACQCLFQTQAVKAVDGWNESYIKATDHELWSRLARLGPMVLLPDIVLLYRVHGGQWCPRNMLQIMNEVRELAVKRTHGKEREQSVKILQARALNLTAFHKYKRNKAASALILYFKTLLRMPRLLQSPLTRPVILIPMAKCLTGSIGLRAGRYLASRYGQIQKHKKIDYSVCNIVDDLQLHGPQSSDKSDYRSSYFSHAEAEKSTKGE